MMPATIMDFISWRTPGLSHNLQQMEEEEEFLNDFFHIFYVDGLQKTLL